MSAFKTQRGVTLVMVLLLLLITTLIGLASLRGVLFSDRASGNLLDRSLSFQAAEMALREAETAIFDAGRIGQPIGYDCIAAVTACMAMPANVFAANTSGCTPNTLNCWRASAGGRVSDLQVAGAPQYYIEFLGERTSQDELGQSANANANQYGGSGGVPLEQVFRITARSFDPSIADTAGRSIVVLQATVARR